MCYSLPIVVVFCALALSVANPVPVPITTTARSNNASIGETIKQLSNQLMELNATSSDVITLDTRTPPKIKLKKKNVSKPEMMESSHAGVAIPLDADEHVFEETTKKLNFYKVEKPTTNSGLSTWILLSGNQVSSTVKPTRKPPTVKPIENTNTTIIIEPNKIIKPIFKKRVTTTTTSTKKPNTSSTISTTIEPHSTTKLTKVKASIMANASKKQPAGTSTTVSSITKRPSPTQKITTTNKPILTSNSLLLESIATNSSSLPLEAKHGETDLSDKKTKRPQIKRKKNKNRRRKPAEKSDNSTASTKIALKKEKPIGTQLYNYLSREVMPTVGVGIVGLVVTAGLASYFLYPFGIARRSYEVDRKDKEGGYYYNSDYSGGIAEEEAIGKVIAGMPASSVYGATYKAPTNRLRNRQVDHRNSPTYDYQPISYPAQEAAIEQNRQVDYSMSDEKQFVVGNTPKIEVTPAAVPEHGPRHLRRRRQAPNEKENEIEIGTTLETTTFESSTVNYSSSTTMINKPDPFNNFMLSLQNLMRTKISSGLGFLQNVTQSVSTYVTKVQQRFNENNQKLFN